MTETRECAYEECSEHFTPKRPHQRFHSEPCRYAQWELDKARESASGGGQRVEGGVGSRGGNVHSVTDARDLQTASKPLDRWRLVMEVQIHRTLLATGHFHIDDLDCLDLPAEAFKVRGTLVSSVRRSGVMASTNVYRKVSHKAANGRPAPIYEITPKGKEQLPKLVGLSSGATGGTGVATAQSGENESVGLNAAAQLDPSLGGPAGSGRSIEPGDLTPGPVPKNSKSGAVSPPTVATGSGSPDSLVQLDSPHKGSSMYDPMEDAA